MALQIHRRINAPVSHVFRMSCDVDRFPDTIPGVLRTERLTEGPIARGTRFRETRKVFGKEHTEEMEFTDFQPDEQYTIACDSCGQLYETTFRFAKVDDGGEEATDLDITMNMSPRTMFGRIMGIVFFPMRGTMRKMMEQDIDHLKTAAEKPTHRAEGSRETNAES